MWIYHLFRSPKLNVIDDRIQMDYHWKDLAFSAYCQTQIEKKQMVDLIYTTTSASCGLFAS